MNSDISMAVMPFMGVRHIPIKDQSTDKHYVIDWDGYLKCAHKSVNVEPPCCGPMTMDDCSCRGLYSVWCYDCKNADMTGDDMNKLIGEPNDGYYE